MNTKVKFFATSILPLCMIVWCSGIIIVPTTSTAQNHEIRIKWGKSPLTGSIEVTDCIVDFVELEIASQAGKVEGNGFHYFKEEQSELILKFECGDVMSDSPLLKIATDDFGFSVLIHQITKNYPIFIPQYFLAITDGTDNRTYDEISKTIRANTYLSKLDVINSLPEVTYDGAKKSSNLQYSPTWLGLGRDIRMFEIVESLRSQPRQKTLIYPQFISRKKNLPDNSLQSVYSYSLGRGHGVKSVSERKLLNSLPILENQWDDDDIQYNTVSFSSLPLSNTGKLNVVNGVDYIISDAFSNGYQHSPGYTKEKESEAHLELEKHIASSGSIILCIKGTATNTGNVPRYVWYKTLYPGSNWSSSKSYNYLFDGENGFSYYDTNQVFAISKMNGKPISSEEGAVLLNPGDIINFEFYLPHDPIGWEVASKMQYWNIDDLFKQTFDYWMNKSTSAAKISVPESRIDEMIKAGLLHLELMTFGNEPHGPLAANAGRFLPIGTESSPIIQYYCSVGKFDLARRCLDYFIEKQRDDGALRNYQGYSVETGAILWTIGEYFRYTHDIDWLQMNKDRIIDACNYLISWRQSDDGENPYKLISGKVADPDNRTRQFMLNGYGYLGLNRMGEVLDKVSPDEAKLFRSEAESWKIDIRKAFLESVAKSPVIPLGDGRWSPTCAPWVEAKGPEVLCLEDGNVFSHGTFTALDALLGPLYLVFCEVIDYEEWYSTMLLEYNSELLMQENVAFSQPYYSRHNWLQLKKNMVKPFINTYYNTMSGMSDPDTYTFSEHTYENSIYKEHEEAWFLMQTRWMLYIEESDTLSLLKAIPRDWMEDGKEIILKEVQSYFGSININVNSHVNEGYIESSIVCEDVTRLPKTVKIRIPHPDNKAPKQVIGGKYDEITETIEISDFGGKSKIRLNY